MVGIFNNVGIATYANNMIRLGIDSAGVSDTSARILSGIRQSTSNASANRYYNNSILIAGEPQSGNANSAAIEIVASIPVVGGFVNVVDIRNNILANNRNNTVNAIGRNWGLKLANTTNIISNYNLYHITGAGGIVGATTVDYYTLNNFDTSWQAVTRLDLASGLGNPTFVAAATGAYNGVILNVQANTPIERSGDATVVLTQDYYGNSRSSLTPTDIGAHAGNFNQTPDVFAPVITFTPLANSGTLSGVRTFADVTITDNNGIPTSGASAPRVY
jgi:hypothetical protein